MRPSQADVNHAPGPSERVFRWWDYPLFIALSSVNFAAIVYFFVYWLSAQDWQRYPFGFTLMTLLLVFNVLIHQLRWFTLPLMRRPSRTRCRRGCRVGVATTFVSSSEPLSMLEHTLRALVALDYPHDTWVLDEEDAETVKALCRRLGAHHFSRKGLRRYQADSGPFASGTKYGNYNAWLTEIAYAQYEIVSAFDPDHVPRSGFLNEVLGYFADPQVGYVQAPQAYYNQHTSFIARGAAEQTYGYSSSIQMADYAMGYPIIMGCHNTHRTAALQQVGGFAAHDADDLLLTIHYRAAGWRGVYVPQILARGLTPVDWRGYLGQQRRWARSVLDVKFRLYPRIARKLPIRERLTGYVHGLYWVQGLSPLLGIAFLAFMLVTARVPVVIAEPLVPRLAGLLGALALAGAYRQRFFLDRQRESGFHWRAMLLEWAKWPALLMALVDLLAQHRTAYVITPKISARSKSRMLLVPHGLAVIVVAAAWVVGVMLGRVMNAILEGASAAVVLGTVALIATEYRRFPEPYDPSLSTD